MSKSVIKATKVFLWVVQVNWAQEGWWHTTEKGSRYYSTITFGRMTSHYGWSGHRLIVGPLRIFWALADQSLNTK